MAGYARIRPELIESGALEGWQDANLQDLEGNELYWTPDNEWVKAICFDGMSTGLYVLTEDEDHYFTCHSIDLEFSDTLPTEREKEMTSITAPQGKHALPYNVHRDLAGAENTFIEMLGQDLDTWQLIARDLARDILRGKYLAPDSYSFARDILNRLSHMPEMNIHPSELSGIGRAK
jgi:hypothetical protein